MYLHPLASYCWKVLIALYEHESPFVAHVVGDDASRAELSALWPIGKFPVLRDRDRVVPESTMIIEYLARHHPGQTELVPRDPDRAFEAREQDRFFDLHVHEQMQKIVGDKIRPDGQKDPHGVAQARAHLETAYGVIEARMNARTWATGDTFTVADCAAAPSLYYANRVAPLGDARPHARAYLARLMARPSCSRVLTEAGPYLHLFPG